MMMYQILALALLCLTGITSGNPLICRQNEKVENGICQRCPHCPIGQGLLKKCGYGKGEGVECEPCPDGQYHDDPDFNFCHECKSCAINKRTVVTNCTAESNTVCGECLPGYYFEDNYFGLKRCSACDQDSAHSDCLRKPTEGTDTTTNLGTEMTTVLYPHLTKDEPVGTEEGNLNEKVEGQNVPNSTGLYAGIGSAIIIAIIIIVLVVLGVVILKRRQCQACTTNQTTVNDRPSNSTSQENYRQCDVEIPPSYVKVSKVDRTDDKDRKEYRYKQKAEAEAEPLLPENNVSTSSLEEGSTSGTVTPPMDNHIVTEIQDGENKPTNKVNGGQSFSFPNNKGVVNLVMVGGANSGAITNTGTSEQGEQDETQEKDKEEDKVPEELDTPVEEANYPTKETEDPKES